VEAESKRRQNAFANRTARWGGRANREAKHKIRMNAKLDSGHGGKET